jgi:transketolase
MTYLSGRDGFGQALLQLGQENEKVVVLTADLAEPTRTHWFQEKYPERFFELGVAEQDLIGTAAGLALTGFIPFATTFAVFGAHRANEQIRMAVCYNRANVKIAVSHGGVTVGEDGATHQALEDIAAMRLLPGMTVLVPADAEETRLATLVASEIEGPVYLRMGRIPTPPITLDAGDFVVGRARHLREGDDVTIIACGTMVGLALRAVERLERQGIRAAVLDMHTIKPLDEEAIIRAARVTGCIVTAEEHSILGGLGGAVAEILSEHAPVPLVRVGTRDTFGESGAPAELLEKYGLSSEAIIDAAQRVLRLK